MKLKKKIYIAATGKNVGKTTISLALTTLLQDHGVRVGFCKPVGQNHTLINGERGECDAIAITSVLGIPFHPSLHSPVIIGPGDTSRYLEYPDPEVIRNLIERAARGMEADYQIVIYEGTGHPGVGSVIDHSNATVAGLLNAEVILVAKGGIGKTLDDISIAKSYFDRGKISIAGVIINQAIPEKIARIASPLEAGLKKMDLRLLGILPFEKVLAFPTLAQIREAVAAEIILEGSGLNVLIRVPVFGIEVNPEETDFQNGKILMVSPVDQIDRLFDSLISHNIDRENKWRIGGVMLTAGKAIPKGFLDLFDSTGIPVLSTPLDTYTVAQRLSNLVARVDPGSVEKITTLKQLLKEHIDLDFLTHSLFGVPS